MGPIASDGDAGLALVAIGDTVAGTAVLETAEATVTDFKIEESDSPIMSIKTEADKITVNWSTNNLDADTLVKAFGGTKVAAVTGALKTLGTITPGSGYTATGVYVDVPLTGGAGTGATADIHVSGGEVTLVVIRNPGSGYTTSGTLSASNANLGGAGTGFAVAVTAVEALSEQWKAPDTIPEIEQTLKIAMKVGGHVLIPRAKIVAKLAMSFKRDALSQIDFSASVLQPTKTGVARLTIASA